MKCRAHKSFTSQTGVSERCPSLAWSVRELLPIVVRSCFRYGLEDGTVLRRPPQGAHARRTVRRTKEALKLRRVAVCTQIVAAGCRHALGEHARRPLGVDRFKPLRPEVVDFLARNAHAAVGP